MQDKIIILLTLWRSRSVSSVVLTCNELRINRKITYKSLYRYMRLQLKANANYFDAQKTVSVTCAQNWNA